MPDGGATVIGALDDVRARLEELVSAKRAELGGSSPFVADEHVDLALKGLAQLAKTDDQGPGGTLERLANVFALSLPEIVVLLAAAAPTMDRRFGLVYSYLEDNGTIRWLTVGTALRIIDQPSWDPEARALVSRGALVKQLLLESDHHPDLLRRPLVVPDRVVEHLMGMDDPHPDVARTVDPLLPAPATVPGVDRALQAGAPLVYVRCAQEAGPIACIGASALKHDIRCLNLNLRRMTSTSTVGEWLALALREAALIGALPVVGPVPDGLPPGALDVLADARVPVALHGRAEWDTRLSTALPASFDIPALTEADQAALWTTAFEALELDLDGAQLGRFHLAPGDMLRAARRAATLARIAESAVDVDSVSDQVRRVHAPVMERLTRRVVPRATLDDLVLPAKVSRTIESVVERVRNRDVVREQFGVRSRGTGGRGLTVLFSGASGTGKTLAAEAICGQLGVDMYVVDVASVLSKYIGETEQNLEQIFSAADDVSGVLFFDEADALFGRRSEVSDAKDRYANIEVGYLLQRLEHLNGVSILASNLRANLDPAFNRRLDFAVEFPEPGPEERARIWELHLPAAVPRAKKLDLAFAAETFELSGGSIAAACTTAVHEVAATGKPLDDAMVARAIALELGKTGRLLDRDRFGRWFDLLAGSG